MWLRHSGCWLVGAARLRLLVSRVLRTLRLLVSWLLVLMGCGWWGLPVAGGRSWQLLVVG